mgnify:CR=1 FL=1
MITPKQQFLASLPGGFLGTETLAKLVELDRLCLVLVRCGSGRFLCPAQDVQHFCAIIERNNEHSHVLDREFVRDWSVNAQDMEKALAAVELEKVREQLRQLNESEHLGSLPIELTGEYDAAAEYYSKTGKLPLNMDFNGALKFIKGDPDAFQERVKDFQYAHAMEGILPHDPRS